ncbi:MAG: polyketide synthase [Cyanobacteria bacterium P01_G01_bin.54]
MSQPTLSKVAIAPLEPGIFQLQINDPQNDNRLDEALATDLVTALNQLAAEPTLKVLVLRGCKNEKSQDIFCAGGSLEFLRRLSSGEASEKELFLAPYHLLNFPVPIVAALEGQAVGGGLTLALYCDVLIASDRSRYGVNFTTMGFTPGMGTTAILPLLVGDLFANEMMLTGKLYKGRELINRGLFNHVVPRDEVYDLSLDIARRMAEKPRYVLEKLRDVLSQPRRQALQTAMSREHLLHELCFAQPETRQMIEEVYLQR